MATQTGNQIHDTPIVRRVNERSITVSVASGIHMSIEKLRSRREEIHCSTYIDKEVAEPNEMIEDIHRVPHYPRPVEFRVSTVAHVTAEPGLYGILDSSGFKGGRDDLLWWGLVIGPEEISAAEQRYLENLFPGRSPEDRDRQKPFLHKFATSPVFKDESRYGNFRFSFSLADVLQAYSTQFCNDQRPVLRVHDTEMYKQEVMYSVLVHSPDVHDYDVCPKLGDDKEGVCAYRDGEIIWRAQAISETHKSILTENTHKKQVNAEPFSRNNNWKDSYVWDHVTLAFHIPIGEILHFSHEKLHGALSACGDADIKLNALMGKEKAAKIVQMRKANK